MIACAASSAATLSPLEKPKNNIHIDDDSDYLSKWEAAFVDYQRTTKTEGINHPLQHTSNEYEYDLRLLADRADDFVLFHGTNCIELTEEVATILQKPVSPLHIGRYADGEISVRLGTYK